MQDIDDLVHDPRQNASGSIINGSNTFILELSTPDIHIIADCLLHLLEHSESETRKKDAERALESLREQTKDTVPKKLRHDPYKQQIAPVFVMPPGWNAYGYALLQGELVHEF